jgi:hypothetical protein
MSPRQQRVERGVRARWQVRRSRKAVNYPVPHAANVGQANMEV